MKILKTYRNNMFDQFDNSIQIALFDLFHNVTALFLRLITKKSKVARCNSVKLLFKVVYKIKKP